MISTQINFPFLHVCALSEQSSVAASNVCNLFMQIIHCCLIYDIIQRLVDSFTGQDIELLLLLLKSKKWFAYKEMKEVCNTWPSKQSFWT